MSQGSGEKARHSPGKQCVRANVMNSISESVDSQIIKRPFVHS